MMKEKEAINPYLQDRGGGNDFYARSFQRLGQNNLRFKMRLLVKNNIPHRNPEKGIGCSECWLKYSLLRQMWV